MEHFDSCWYFLLDQYVIDLNELTELHAPFDLSKYLYRKYFAIVYQYKAYMNDTIVPCTMILLIKHAHRERISSCECECEQKS